MSEPGHLPFWKRCKACLDGRARDRPHRRQGVVETSVLSFDLAGPFQVGKDEDMQPTRYALTAVFTVADPVKLQELEDQAREVSPGEPAKEKLEEDPPEAGEDGVDRFGGALGDDEWLEGNDDDDDLPGF